MAIALMPFASKSHGSAYMVNISGSLTIDTVNDHIPKLKKVYNKSCQILLNIGHLDECDTAGIQLLWTFVNDVQKKGNDIELHALSDSFKTSAEISGFDLKKMFSKSAEESNDE